MKTLILLFAMALSTNAYAVKVGDYAITRNTYNDPSQQVVKIETIKQTVLEITVLNTGETELKIEQQMSMNTGESGTSIQYMKIADPKESVCPLPLFGGTSEPLTIGALTLQTCHLSFPGGQVEIWLLPDFPGIAKMIVLQTLEDGRISETITELIEYSVTP